MSEYEEVSGQKAKDLAQAIAETLSLAIKDGIRPDQAVCIAASVAADYGRMYYGNPYCDAIAQIVSDRGSLPMPPQQSLN